MSLFKWIADQFDPDARVARKALKEYQSKIDFATNDLWESWTEYIKKDWHDTYEKMASDVFPSPVPDKTDLELQKIMLVGWTDFKMRDRIASKSSQIPAPNISGSLDKAVIKSYFTARAQEYWSQPPAGKEY